MIRENEEDLCKYENELYKRGYSFIGGIDEVGRGPLIGSVVAACVVLPVGFQLEGLTDSKKLSAKKRNYFYNIIMEKALGVGIGIVDECDIDKYNIYKATKIAMKQAIDNVKSNIDYLLIDAMELDVDIPTLSIIKGDSKSISIAAASVIAKVTRDKMMNELDKKYPVYGLAKNKGYPTKQHLDAIKKYGITKYHRLSFKPVRDNKDKVYVGV
ncbi:MAG: ribonuclease HII [bacterium]|nr:ribonuclease HII [bacterium]